MAKSMKATGSYQKATQQTTNETEQPSAGPDGLAISAPPYGLESIDQPIAVPTPEPEQAFGAPLQMKTGESSVGSGTITPPPNRTGMPDVLKGGIESLSGMAMDDVRVHYNSPKPAQLQALAYTQGTDIHVAPGQERHLPHEAWHVVQQKQGRVRATTQMKSQPINDQASLEQEADLMGAKAAGVMSQEPPGLFKQTPCISSPEAPIQRMLVGIEMETVVPIYEQGLRPDHVDGYAEQASEYEHENVEERLRLPLGKGFELHVDSSSLAPKQALQKVSPGSSLHIMEIVSKPVASRAALLLKLQTARNFLKVLETYSEVNGARYSVGWPIPQAPFTPKDAEASISTEELEEVFSRDYDNGKSRLYNVASQLTFQLPVERLADLSALDTMEYATGETIEETRHDQKFVFDKAQGKKVWKEIPRTVRSQVRARHPIVDRDSMASAMFLSDALHNTYIRRLVDITVKIFKDMLSFVQGNITGTVKNSVSYLVRSDLGALFPHFSIQQAQQMKEDIITILTLTTVDELNIPARLLADIYDREHDAIILKPSTFRSITAPPKREEGELEHINATLRESLRTKAIGEGTLWPWKEAMKWLGNEVGNAITKNSGPVTGPLHGSRTLDLLPERNQDTEIEELTQIEQVNREWLDDPERNPYPEEVVPRKNHNQGLAQAGVVVEDRAPLALDISENELPAPVTERLDQIGFPE